ncbi:MAG TPA: acyl-CoA dehydrogenase [Sneathiellales bacterium]|nr:acyl-CoA dehydrogenase [Sneathiellales bacterium]
MAIDFTLTPEQQAIQRTAREFANDMLKPIVAKADAEPDPQKAFLMTKPAYMEGYKLGFAMGFLPRKYGGAGIKHVDMMLAGEEIAAVDPAFGGTLLVNGLSLNPLLWFGNEDQKDRWLNEATSDPTGEYITGYTLSEPGGTANFDHPGKAPVGLGLIAEHDKGRGEYVLNGSKYWPTNSGGWDLKGANLNVVAIRTDPDKGGREGLSYILIPRGTKGITYKQPIDKMAHRLDQNNQIEYEDCRVPEENVFAVGDGDLVIAKAFTWTGPAVGIAAVGNARAAYEWTLDWAKSYTGAGSVPIIEHQAVGHALADVAMKIEAARYLCWKTAHYLDMFDCEGQAFGAMAKVLPSELLKDAVYSCMQIVGVNSLLKEYPMEKFMREALVFPIYDGGNMGMQRRKIWGVMADPDFNPRAFAECQPVPYKKSMTGYGVQPGKRD